jgi:hypothetical protein
MKDRDFHLRKAKKNKNSRHWGLYRQLRNTVNLNIKQSKSEYYTNLIEDNNGNPKDFWRALKQTLPSGQSSNISSIEVNGTTVTTPHLIASTLNSFFVSIGKKLAENFNSVPGTTTLCSTFNHKN